MKIYSYRGKKNLSGDKIREARLKQRLSQSDLAAKVQIAGVTLERDSISRIEIGTRFLVKCVCSLEHLKKCRVKTLCN